MLGLQARKTEKPMASEYTSKARRPLQDIDVNRSHHSILSSKDGQNAGKASLHSGFQVFADGGTSSTKKVKVKEPGKSSAADAKPIVGGITAFQPVNRIWNKHVVTKDIGSIRAEQIAVGLKTNSGACNANSLSECTATTTAAQNTKMELLQNQLALMQVEKMTNQPKAQVPATDPQNVEGIEKAVSTVIPFCKENDSSGLGAKQQENNICAGSENLGLEQKQKSVTNNTGAIRKVVSNVACASEVNHVKVFPTFPFNVMAKEWTGTASIANKESLYDDGNPPVFTQPSIGVQQFPTIWNSQATNSQPNLPNHYTDANGAYCHDFPTTTQPTGRKIVGRKLSPLPRSLPAQCDILSELDDRTQEIWRFKKYQESRRIKATEAMRVQQERTNRMSAHRQNVWMNMQHPMQPTATTSKTNPTTCSGVNGSQRTTDIPLVQMPILPPPTTPARPKPNVCIIKYPTPPNAPIRYEPSDLLKMNYTSNKNLDKCLKKDQEKSKK
uniref:Uncharacterized protein n=1 Tax=Anopheles minimus TaxID=112268 RepID=A0A182WH56_9DIPT